MPKGAQYVPKGLLSDRDVPTRAPRWLLCLKGPLAIYAAKRALLLPQRGNDNAPFVGAIYYVPLAPSAFRQRSGPKALWLLCPSRPILRSSSPLGTTTCFSSPKDSEGPLAFRQRSGPLGIYCVVALWAKQSGRRVGGALSAFSPLGIYCGPEGAKGNILPAPLGTLYSSLPLCFLSVPKGDGPKPTMRTPKGTRILHL